MSTLRDKIEDVEETPKAAEKPKSKVGKKLTKKKK